MFFNIQWNSIFIVILLLNWVIEGGFKEKMSKIRPQIDIFLLFITLYWVNSIGLLYTTEWNDAFHEITTKLSLFIFPVVFLGNLHEITAKHQKNIFLAFISAVFIACLFTFSQGFEFSSDTLSGILVIKKTSLLHRPYLAMYVILGVFMLLYLLLRSQNSVEERILSLLAILFLAFFITLKATTAFIAFLVAFTFVLLTWILHRNQLIAGLITFILVINVLFFSYPFDNFLQQISRIDYIDAHMDNPNIDKQANPRAKIWECAWGVINASSTTLWLGVGTGNAQKVLNQCYEEKKLALAKDYNLNAHNEYLQMWLRQGIIGLVVFLLNLLVPLLIAINQRNYLLIVFITIIAVCSFSETLLSRQAGTVFYAFFNALLYFYFLPEKDRT